MLWAYIGLLCSVLSMSLLAYARCNKGMWLLITTLLSSQLVLLWLLWKFLSLVPSPAKVGPLGSSPPLLWVGDWVHSPLWLSIKNVQI